MVRDGTRGKPRPVVRYFFPGVAPAMAEAINDHFNPAVPHFDRDDTLRHGYPLSLSFKADDIRRAEHIQELDSPPKKIDPFRCTHNKSSVCPKCQAKVFSTPKLDNQYELRHGMVEGQSSGIVNEFTEKAKAEDMPKLGLSVVLAPRYGLRARADRTPAPAKPAVTRSEVAGKANKNATATKPTSKSSNKPPPKEPNKPKATVSKKGKSKAVAIEATQEPPVEVAVEQPTSVLLPTAIIEPESKGKASHKKKRTVTKSKKAATPAARKTLIKTWKKEPSAVEKKTPVAVKVAATKSSKNDAAAEKIKKKSNSITVLISPNTGRSPTAVDSTTPTPLRVTINLRDMVQKAREHSSSITPSPAHLTPPSVSAAPSPLTSPPTTSPAATPPPLVPAVLPAPPSPVEALQPEAARKSTRISAKRKRVDEETGQPAPMEVARPVKKPRRR
ncbi:hypothetical protein CALCODRAFT_87550 [Calocera cornea HHB12733]|uniref:Uncharacterized protein n=1 Tax=Calocera cornea HHB12733 TaxID=1353952 RepID=A0A165DC81_9BASI|nr:hypothetical protein CALCODRAFT_87550 [Calocera cornea HHB12733]